MNFILVETSYDTNLILTIKEYAAEKLRGLLINAVNEMLILSIYQREGQDISGML